MTRTLPAPAYATASRREHPLHQFPFLALVEIGAAANRVRHAERTPAQELCVMPERVGWYRPTRTDLATLCDALDGEPTEFTVADIRDAVYSAIGSYRHGPEIRDPATVTLLPDYATWFAQERGRTTKR